MNIVEDRIAALEAEVRTGFAHLRAELSSALAVELGWCERYWAYIALAAFVAGVIVKAVA